MAEKFRCECCGQHTLEAQDEYDICEVCGWEEDRCKMKIQTMLAVQIRCH